MTYHPITKKMAQDRVMVFKPVYGEIHGKRYRIVSVGYRRCRTICGEVFDADKVKYDDGITLKEK